MCASSDDAAKSTTISEREPDQEKDDQEKSLNPSGPRIRCPLCAWVPGQNDVWCCNCGHTWNTFDTAGVCPGCLFQWTSTQCLACERWSRHSEWYAQ